MHQIPVLLSNENNHIGIIIEKINNTKKLHKIYTKQCSESFQHMNIFNSHNNPMKYAWYIPLIYIEKTDSHSD